MPVTPGNLSDHSPGANSGITVPIHTPPLVNDTGSISLFPPSPSLNTFGNRTSLSVTDHLSHLRLRRTATSSAASNTSLSDDDDDDVDRDFMETSFVDEGTASHRGKGKERREVIATPGDPESWREGQRRSFIYPSTNGSGWEHVEEMERSSPADDLPPEIIVHILKSLTNTSDLQSSLLVSRSWCQCTVPLIWSKPPITSRESLRSLIHVIQKRNTTFPYSQFIKRINFVAVHGVLQDAQLMEFAACTRIERLTLTGSRNIGSATLCYVLGKMSELIAVDLAGVSSTNDAVLHRIAETTSKLQGINLTGCPAITDDGIIAIAKSNKVLRRLKVVDCKKLSDQSIIAVAKACPLILEYDVAGVDDTTDEGSRAIWMNSSLLRELRWAGNVRLTQNGFPMLSELRKEIPVATQFVHLRTVDLTGCIGLTDAAIEALVTNAPKIRSLTLAKCINLTDVGMDSICKLGKQMHLLHLGHVALITDAAVCKIARSCTRLRYIDLACCSQLTDMSVFEIAQNLSKLRRIGLVKVVNITDQAIQALVDRGDKHVNNLERVHLSYCDNLTVPAITYMLARIPRITHLSLTGVSSFRSPEYQRFCRSPPKEFNTHQRMAFCVFSGKGVQELRQYLLFKGSSPQRLGSNDLLSTQQSFINHRPNGQTTENQNFDEVNHALLNGNGGRRLPPPMIYGQAGAAPTGVRLNSTNNANVPANATTSATANDMATQAGAGSGNGAWTIEGRGGPFVPRNGTIGVSRNGNTVETTTASTASQAAYLDQMLEDVQMRRYTREMQDASRQQQRPGNGSHNE